MDNSASELNSQQNEAVTTLSGPLLILAGAGAGKTKTIVHRILNLIKSGINPHSILAITFTNKAAKEMRDRVNSLLESDKRLESADFHERKAFRQHIPCPRRAYNPRKCGLIGLTRHFTIYDRADSKRAVKDALNNSA